MTTDLVKTLRSVEDAHGPLSFCQEAADELELLRAAIATPEVYGGVITRVLEDERDKAITDLTDFTKQILETYPEWHAGCVDPFTGEKKSWEGPIDFVRTMIDSRTDEITCLQKDLDSAQKLVALYQSEGQDEVPEETEYKALVKIAPRNRAYVFIT